MNKNSLYSIAGSIWVMVGAFLIYRGTVLYQLAVAEQNSTQNAIIISIIAGLIIGAAKGKFVLSKTARRNKSRIAGLSEPLKAHNIFSGKFYILIIGMIALGVLLRHFNEYLGGYVVVGAIYYGIGMALIVSSATYWKNNPETAAEIQP